MKSYLLGKIKLDDLTGKKLAKFYIVNSKSKDISISDTFMQNFNDMGLSGDEKQQLTQENRCELIHYKSLTMNEIKTFVNELVSKIAANKSESIAINATGFGAYICLTAITGELLPKNKRYQFNLEGMPIKLFPKDFIKIKKSIHNIEISYTIKDQCWLKSFSSLTSPPDYLGGIDQLMDLRMPKKSSLTAA